MLGRILALPIYITVLAMAMFVPVVIFFAARAGGMVGYSLMLIFSGIYPSFLTFLHLGWIEHVLVKRLQLPKLADQFTNAMIDVWSPGVNAHIYLLRMVPADWQLQADRPIYEKALRLARRHQLLLALAWWGLGVTAPSGSSGSSAWSTRRRNSKPPIVPLRG